MKIAVTGGPTAGKTALVDTLFLSFSDRLGIVQEAASLLFRAGFPRADNDERRRVQERAIYHMQTALEDLAALDQPDRVLLCDRGTLDGLAYWPGSEESYFEAIGSTMEKELGRYDWVLHVDVVPPYDFQPNTLRTETAEEIVGINERLKQAWRLHPRRCILSARGAFMHKLQQATNFLDRALDGDRSFKSRASCLTEISNETAKGSALV